MSIVITWKKTDRQSWVIIIKDPLMSGTAGLPIKSGTIVNFSIFEKYYFDLSKFSN